MIPSLTTDPCPALLSPARPGFTTDQDGGSNVLGALLEALNSPERHRLIQRDGELFIEPAN